MQLQRREFFHLAALSQASVNGPFQPIQRLLSGKDPVTWVFTGDSITHGALHTLGWRSYPEHFAERVRWEMRRFRDVVINTAISGDRMSRLLSDVDWRVHRFQPHVVSLMMGMNDCAAGPSGRKEFRDGVESFHQQVQERNGLLLLHTSNTIWIRDRENERRQDLPAYMDILRDIAASRNIPLVDHYRHWSETRKDPNELNYLLSDAAVHPNQYGHSEFANLLFKELGIFDSSSRTCRMFIP